MRHKRPLTQRECELLERPDLAPAAECYAEACMYSREHSSYTEQALTMYGAHGPMISGCVREHFPERTKDRLRGLARNVTVYSSAAQGMRPPRVHATTMRALARAIAARDGSGFYGPQS